MPEFIVHMTSKAGDQYIRVQAKNRAEAEARVTLHNQERARRYDLTMQRIESAEGNFADMSPAQRKAELERRKRDFSRYDVIRGDEIGAADAPLKIAKISEAK